MQSQLNINGLFVFLASALGAISFAVAIVVLAMSRDHWGTLKTMCIWWLMVLLSGIAAASALGYLFNNRLLVGVLGSTSVGAASVVGLVMGIRHLRAVR
jgi:hypothetical protein